MAYISNDTNLIEAFNNNIDIHTATASLLFSTAIEDVTNEMRRTAKTVNFGIMYGLGTFGLSQRLNITRTAADAIIQNYFEKFPGIKTYVSDTLNSVRKFGYAETVTGRKRFFPDINHKNFNIRSAAERAAVNMPIQGSASDMIKIAMINIYQILKQQNLKSKMILQVHDELLFETAIDEIDLVADIVNTQMLYALPLGDVPLAVSIGFGKNWLEAHS
ncbi:DNA polymerase I [bioreactor metagenome]|uniref:DNA-directed DNA polymerase n=1 Tax=bioreactor metagenome TaxID=1076179 RepID=A0A645FZC4_9ZZZZ